MENQDKNYISEGEMKVLSVSCADSLEVKARVTFDSSVVDGIRLTYWEPEVPDSVESILDDMFSILFEEVVKARKVKSLLEKEGLTRL